jgi:heptosyltransferase-2
MILKPDCRHFPGDRPCHFNKDHGQTCPDCGHYATQGTRILLIKLAALGDVLRTTALLPALKRQWPHSYLVWLTQADAVDLLRGNPGIDEIWTVESDAPARLALERFDLVLNPDADKRAAALASLAQGVEKRGLVLDVRGCLAPANPEAVTWLEMGAFDQLKQQNQRTYQALIHEMLRLPADAHQLTLPLTEAEFLAAGRKLQALGWSERDSLIGLNVGGGGRWKKKRWKEHHFLAFLRRAVADFGAKVLLIGGPQEGPLLERLVGAGLPGVFTAGPRCALRETAALIRQCQVLLTGDTLAFHLGAALGVPTVVLLGPTSAAELDLYERGEKIIAPIGCVGCYLTDCAVDPDCMELITPDQVLAAVRRWLPPTGAGATAR